MEKVGRKMNETERGIRRREREEKKRLRPKRSAFSCCCCADCLCSPCLASAGLRCSASTLITPSACCAKGHSSGQQQKVTADLM